jgi:hypothetical protein
MPLTRVNDISTPAIEEEIMNHTAFRHPVVLLFAFSLVHAQQPLQPPLRHWAAPLYWAPQPGEIENQRAAPKDVWPLPRAASIFTAPGPMTFIALTPCRVMDTRVGSGFTGAFGPPSLPAQTPRQVPIPGSSCNIPYNAGAYSLNITAVPPGSLGYLSVWPAGQPFPTVSTLNAPNGGPIANEAIVPAGTGGAIQMLASGPTDVIIDINGYYAPPSDMAGNTAVGTGALANNTIEFIARGSGNTANGSGALESNTTGSNNTSNGYFALAHNTIGNSNTASGAGALASNTSGNGNTASGDNALVFNTSGNGNTASGEGALQSNTSGNSNTASGAVALQSNTSGNNNTASGNGALEFNTTGSNNIAIGYLAGRYVSSGNSNNIHIGNQGSSADSGTIRIGTPCLQPPFCDGTQTSFFVAGVRGVTTANNDAIPVVIDSAGQLGTVSSSRRFKEDIQDMGDISRGLMRLRPVSFRYRKPFADDSKPIQYGLIAEEVAEVYPDLVAHSADGQIETVKYQVLDAMLLNEVQRQQKQIYDQQKEISAQREQMGTQAGQIRDLQEQLRELKRALTSLWQQ